MKIIRCIYILLGASLCTGLFGAQINVCTTCEYTSVASGIDIAKPGDTVIIMSGIYLERGLVIDIPMFLTGNGQPVIDGGLKGEILTITADHVTVSGITFRNVGISYLKDWAAIRVRYSREFTIRDNIIENSFFGIYLERAKNGIVANNHVEGQAVEEMSSGNAIHLWYCERINVEDNTVRHHRDGIYLEFVDNSFVGCNVSDGNLRYGLHFMFSNDNVYLGNQFSHNGAGVAVMFSRRIRMEENMFIENWGKAAYGLLLKEIFDGWIVNNEFRKNTTGIFVEGSNRIEYLNNNFLNNGWAMKISGGCEDNRLKGNNFIANSFDLATASSLGDNAISGNYWSDYAGYDLDRDGLGDVPHRPVKLFNYIVNKSPEAIILLRSIFVDLINYSERVSPIFTPALVADTAPLMSRNTAAHDSH